MSNFYMDTIHMSLNRYSVTDNVRESSVLDKEEIISYTKTPGKTNKANKILEGF